MIEFTTFGFQLPPKETSAEVLGGKGAGLVWMDQIEGVTVPPGFIIPTSVWAEYQQKPKTTMKEIAKALPAYLGALEQYFGYRPLLSVRSGARVSCPGMMDTILNVGIDESTETLWMEKLGAKCLQDSWHRLIIMYGSVVKGIPRKQLEPPACKDMIDALALYSHETGESFPDAKAQLLGSIEAVFKSWDNDRAKVYRKLNGIPEDWGTAVTVQAMVFGNFNDQSGTGVLFTRNPDTGECKVTGEFLPNAQGEDIVAGIRTPKKLEEMYSWNDAVTKQLLDTVIKLEKLRKDMQDCEFTVQDGKLYLLQTRNAKRSAFAAIRVAMDMFKEGLITKAEAVKRVEAKQFDLAQMASLDPKFKKAAAFSGKPACSGVVTGRPVFSAQDAIACKEPCILVAEETTPDDIAGMYAAAGVVTMKGGATSHAAVVARSMNRACITGVGAAVEDFKEVETLSMDGATGRIWTEKIPIISAKGNGVVAEFTRLVFETLGVVPILFAPPAVDYEQALLYLGHRVLNQAEAIKAIIAAAAKVNRLYVDLVPDKGSPEAEYLTLVASYDPCQKLVKLLEDLVKLPEHKGLKKKLVIMGGVKTKVFSMVGTAVDMRSVILAEKELAAEGLDFADPAVQKVLSWKKAEGFSLISVGKVAAEMKSMVSVEQALQLLSS